MRIRLALVATLAWLLGFLVLGTSWEGVRVAPGVWEDGVSLREWSWFWLALGALGLLVSRAVTTWSARLLALGPLLGWIAWSLWGGGLGPIPLVIYAVPTLLVWMAAATLGDVGWRVARSVKRHPP